MIASPWSVSVLIPARNEENLLPRCLASVVAAIDRLPLSVTSNVIVVADSCTDRTRKIAEEMLSGRGTVISIDTGSVGCARATAARSALQRYSGDLSRLWLANTDADCSVPVTWLSDQLLFANNHVEAVAGTIDVDCFDEHDDGVQQRFRDSYLIGMDGSHPHVHGANLGVRADAYLRAGGWNAIATAEDHDLWRRLLRSGCKRESVGNLRVITSGRRVGRAPFGFADALAAHNETAA